MSDDQTTPEDLTDDDLDEDDDELDEPAPGEPLNSEKEPPNKGSSGGRIERPEGRTRP